MPWLHIYYTSSIYFYFSTSWVLDWSGGAGSFLFFFITAAVTKLRLVLMCISFSMFYMPQSTVMRWRQQMPPQNPHLNSIIEAFSWFNTTAFISIQFNKNCIQYLKQQLCLHNICVYFLFSFQIVSGSFVLFYLQLTLTSFLYPKSISNPLSRALLRVWKWLYTLEQKHSI